MPLAGADAAPGDGGTGSTCSPSTNVSIHPAPKTSLPTSTQTAGAINYDAYIDSSAHGKFGQGYQSHNEALDTNSQFLDMQVKYV